MEAAAYLTLGLLGTGCGIWLAVWGGELALVGSGIIILGAWIAGTAARGLF